MHSRHWFVPLDHLDAEAGAELIPADEKPREIDPMAQEGDSFLITLETVLIAQKYDSKSDNDLLVRSRLKYGNDPLLEAINFFANDVSPGEAQTNLLCEHIYTRQTYTKLDRIHLTLEVMELPGEVSLNSKIGRGLTIVKNTFGVVLSSLLPFGGVAFSVMEKLNSVRSKKRQIFLSALDLYGDGGEGEARLRYGAYVFFQEPVDGSQYRLRQLQLTHSTAEASERPIPYNYLVVKIVPNAIRVGSDDELRLHNQELAAALATNDGQLDSTLRYPSFKDKSIPNGNLLRRLALLYRLQKRMRIEGILDEAQAQVYQTLQQELKDFL
ncbi:MAG: hypothetical protein AAF821_20090 [Cyanobacteria bacterium P01_D01_bin.156]